MDRLIADLSYGLRMLVRYPTLSLAAIVTRGVGIGLSTTVFCVVNTGMFKGLPLPNADRIVAVYASNSRSDSCAFPSPYTISLCTRPARRPSKRSAHNAAVQLFDPGRA